MTETRTISLADIENVLESIDPITCMEAAFRSFSRGEALMPPPGELIFQNPPGDVHIKYGYIEGGDYYVVKIASGFYENPARGLPSSNGVMLGFHRDTGALAAILDDKGHLTDIRTAAAGAVAAKYLAPEKIDAIGVIGTGRQAELQVLFLQHVRPCKNIVVWGRRPEGAASYARRMEAHGFDVAIAATPDEVGARCRLIVTTTPSEASILLSGMIRPGTHITAMGADTPDKRELDPELFARAGIIAADSRTQGAVRGDLKHALEAGTANVERVIELGEIIDGSAVGRTSDDQISIAALTGLGVQDVAIASAVMARA